MKVGFIGLGAMGGPMAANVAKAGHELTLYDAEAGRAAKLAAEIGAKVAKSIVELSDNEAIVTMLPTGQIVRSVFLEADGGALGKALRPGTLVIDMSSSEPVGTQALGAEIAKTGAVLIDAPVSGGVPRAVSGELTIMIGGDDKAAVERAKPLLLAMGKRLFDTGPLGSGHAMKALNNYASAAAYTATAEAMLIGKRFGLDLNTMIDIMDVSTGKNFHTQHTMKDHVIAEKYATGFALGLLAKDVKIASDLGKAVGIDAPVSRLITDRLALARDELGATKDNSEAIRAWDKDL